MELRWGLVGLGRLAEEYLVEAFAKARNGRLVACAGSSLEKSQRFAGAHSVERAYGSFEELLQDPSVDAVYVATPNHLHYPAVLAAAAAGKPVLCQKPVGLTVAEAEEMVEACRKAGVLLKVGLQSRFQQVLQEAAAVVREGRLGSLREVSVQRYGPVRPTLSGWQRDLATAGSGVLAGLGVHAIDFVQWIVGDQIARVFGVAYPGRGTGQPDTNITMVLEFAGGCQATIRCGRGMPFGTNDLQAFGNLGMLATGPLRWGPADRLTVRTAGGAQEREYPREPLYLKEVEAFGDEIAGECTWIATGEQGVRLAKITDAVIRSFETGSMVSVED